MPTVDENRDYWNAGYPWLEGGAEWSRDWGSVATQWHTAVLPRIASALPAATIVDLGCGHGRWSAYLKDHCRQLICVDVAPTSVEVCRARFREAPNVTCHENEGRSLPFVASASVDLIFSYDSLPMADAQTMRAYLAEIARVLAPGGRAFLHHSNLGAHPWHERARALPWLGPALRAVGLVDSDVHWRDPSVDARSVARWAARHGLGCKSQELFKWGTRHVYLDAFTVLVTGKVDSTDMYKNDNFDLVAQDHARISRMYGAADTTSGTRSPASSAL